MKKTTFLKTMLLLCALIAGGSSAWADITTTYVFVTDRYWKATCEGEEANWTSNVRANGFNATQGIQITTGSNGANATSPKSFSNVKKIVVTYSTNNKAGAGAIKVKVGSGTEQSFAVSAPSEGGGTTDKTKEFTFSPTETGFVTLTVNCTTNSIYIKNISITEEVASYEITAVANSETMGSVSVTGTTITAKPNTGYRVKAGDYGYTVTSGEATVINNEDNTFSVTPSSDCTVQINFEAIPTRKITVTPSADGTITVKNGETPVASGSPVYEGTVLTIEAEAGVNKEFDSWSVTGATPASPTEASTTLTVGENDITIAATFNDIITHAISWSVNGVIIDTENIKHGDAIDFAAPASGVPAGYAFKGWVKGANKIDGTTDTEPSANYETTAKSTEDITYYAVLAKGVGAPASLIQMKKGDTFAANDKIVIVAVIDESTSYGMYQETQSSSYVKNFSFTEDVDDIAADSKKWWTMTAGVADGTWILGDDTNGHLYTSGSNNLSVDDENATEWTFVSNDDGTFKFKGGSNNRWVSCRTDLTGGNQNLYRMAGSTPAGVYNFNIYKYSEDAVTYSGYCTTIPTFAVTVTSAAKYATFSDATDRDFSGSGITVYTAKATGSSVQLTEVKDGIVPANTGVVLYAADGATENIPAVYTTKTTLDENEMVANVTEAVVAKDGDDEKTNYILANGSAGVGFYQATDEGAKLYANRAYLSTTSTGTGSAAREFLGFGDGETTAIDGVKAASVENGAVYNLAGQRVAQPTKGLYIVNGKKYIVK